MASLIIPVLKRDRELEVRTATYGAGIDQSQHAKSVSHIIKIDINTDTVPNDQDAGYVRAALGSCTLLWQFFQ